MTVAPADSNRSTMAEPIPPLEPVTTTTRTVIAPVVPLVNLSVSNMLGSDPHHRCAHCWICVRRRRSRSPDPMLFDQDRIIRAPTSPSNRRPLRRCRHDLHPGPGNDLCCVPSASSHRCSSEEEVEELVGIPAGFWRRLTNDGQLRWLGPEKGVIHLATAALVNAVWDLWAKTEGEPLWQLVADMTPEQFVGCVDFVTCRRPRS